MVTMFQGEKSWHCRLPNKTWELFKTNNPKVTPEYVASHFLGWNNIPTEGTHTVYVKDLAEQITYEVILRQYHEVAQGTTRGRREKVSIREIEL